MVADYNLLLKQYNVCSKILDFVLIFFQYYLYLGFFLIQYAYFWHPHFNFHHLN